MTDTACWVTSYSAHRAFMEPRGTAPLALNMSVV
ncbi:hypothetical protein H310_09140 [Aphanomyces invadans]|uniref:Uncharacterized protein n=1 Tax=Aphanomyces invadans TaxID=157072 RepID=A0A024TUS6_9STRA|nr:hypothetical protein H310_09140 [Aphanomyces invadans]ETV97788.1 hypothetical protein H310_09140 [Aphanomyces invadans]|eukprot:XP_008873349.1 hypothetical protein H310_09140 [Aphanomyces invadans]